MDVVQGNSPFCQLNSPHEAANDNLQLSTCGYQRGSVDTENASNNQPFTAKQHTVEAATGHAAAPDNHKVLELNDDSSRGNVLPVRRRLVRSQAKILPATRGGPWAVLTLSKDPFLDFVQDVRAKEKIEPSCDVMTAITPAILTTGIHGRERQRSLWWIFSTNKKPRRTTATRLPFAHTQCKAACRSPTEATPAGISADHVFSSTSLYDIETIRMRGFLTRRIFLKRVYSFTFEEQRENSCSHRSREVPETRCANRHSKSLSSKKCRAVNTSKGTRFLPEDDKLLIELEEWNLPWSRILEYFPRRSKSSLQVRYVRSSRTEESKAVPNTMPHSPVSGRDSSRKAFDLV
ncbi:conserved hypothetical protein [Histoplasma capsulatum H143]|uniref:Myb-like domain-containing protein n=1 Tax=Ajellomyces capsulatus (strain H143) TaxID=544712 RepID=C6HMX0_AJECH|nr:conserved hypothetical protein [Histoplasma capsulatum H143]